MPFKPVKKVVMLIRTAGVALTVAMFTALGASCAPSTSEQAAEGTSAAALSAGAALETWDGVTAHVYGGVCEAVYATSGTGVHYGGPPGVRTDTCGFQCVELAVRYLAFRRNVPATEWSVGTASEMCGNHPSSVITTQSPAPGDLAVLYANDPGTGTGSAGHVAVIRGVESNGSLDLFQQRWANESTAFFTGMGRSHVACILHAKTAASGGPGACGCYTGDGAYCGAEMLSWKESHHCDIAGVRLSPGADPHHDIDPRFLYQCRGGTWTIEQECNLSGKSCHYNPNGADYCQ